MKIVCEKVTVADSYWLVQYDADNAQDQSEKQSCLAYLTDCGHTPVCKPHVIVGIGDDPAVSWGDLSDIVEPGDD